MKQMLLTRPTAGQIGSAMDTVNLTSNATVSTRDVSRQKASLDMLDHLNVVSILPRQ